MDKYFRHKILLRFMRFYPPYWGAGVKVERFSKDLSQISVSLKLKFWNQNYVGTAFGGSIYSMVDPFYMLMLLIHLGPGYIVWDKAAEIKFIKPGRGKLFAHFSLDKDYLESLKNTLKTQDKLEPIFAVEILDEDKNLIAVVNKTLYIRKKI